MKTRMTEMFGIDVPIFAFSHCRDVVVEATRAGGMGVLGTTRVTPEQLEMELKWIDDHTDGRPYALDLALPQKMEEVHTLEERAAVLPKEHVAFVDKILSDAGIPELPEYEREQLAEYASGYRLTAQGGMELIEVALRHPQIRLVVSALGIAPKEMIDLLHARGLKVGALIGSTRQAKNQVDAGIDVLIAQGMEAGAHTGSSPRWCCGRRSSTPRHRCRCWPRVASDADGRWPPRWRSAAKASGAARSGSARRRASSRPT